jgi:toxin CptA
MDLRTLEPRLENWARAQRSSGYAPGRAASAEGMWRGGGWRETKARPDDIDLADAQLVNEAWKRCMPHDKEVLQMHYVWRAHSSFICRRLKLKQGRGNEHIWEFALYHAHQAISSGLQKAVSLAEPINAAYNPRRLLIPA